MQTKILKKFCCFNYPTSAFISCPGYGNVVMVIIYVKGWAPSLSSWCEQV